MELKGRLKLIADKVPVCAVACDIGSDHAYIPIHLIRQGICKKVIATDVKKGPVEIIIKNLDKFNIKSSIETRMGNGLDVIKVHECEVIIIAGMGGLLIKNILEKGMEASRSAKTLIIQPMNIIPELRMWLVKNGFEIFDEELVEDGGKIYTVLCAKWTGVSRETDELACLIGSMLIKKKDLLLKKHIAKEIDKLEKALDQMKNMIVQDEEKKNEYILRLERLKYILGTV